VGVKPPPFPLEIARNPGDSITIYIKPTFNLVTDAVVGGSIVLDYSGGNIIEDSVVNVKAVPINGWRFVRWTGDLAGYYYDRNIVVNRQKTIGVIFEPIPQYSVKIFSNGGKVLQSPSSDMYFLGSKVDLRVIPDEGWSFINWSGDVVGNTVDQRLTIESNVEASAIFGTSIRTLSSGGGTILLYPELDVYPYGSKVKVMPVPDSGSYFVLWGDAGAGQPRNEWTFTVTNASPRITGLFRPLNLGKVAVTAQSSMGGRVIQSASDGIYNNGATAILRRFLIPDLNLPVGAGMPAGRIIR